MRQLLLLSLSLLVLVGCDARIDRFETNDVYVLTLARSRSVPTDAVGDDVATVVTELFGSPDDPRWPGDLLGEDASSLVDAERLTRAAGPVSSEKDGTHLGLFREHCVVCHGIAGSGSGPASLFQNPYPRDFRHGVFKWKSTERAARPTRGDLRRVIEQGVPGTAMPAFSLLDSDDIEALVDYVVYLSVRGEVERRLMAAAVDELDYAETPPEDELRLSASGETEGNEVVREVLARVTASWRRANESVVPVPSWEPLDGPAYSVSVGRGKEIFHGQIAHCVGCHGPSGQGGVVTLDYDDWAKEYSTRIGVTPDDREAMRPFRDAGAPKPRPAAPRHLHGAVLRGGDDPQTLYRRITQGIAGTPMPAVAVVAQADGRGLTEEQVWDLVRYVRSLVQTAPEVTR